MNSESEIIEIANRHLLVLAAEIGTLLVVTGKPRKVDGGYLINYDAKSWVVDGDISSALAGNTPFFISSVNGAVFEDL